MTKESKNKNKNLLAIFQKSQNYIGLSIKADADLSLSSMLCMHYMAVVDMVLIHLLLFLHILICICKVNTLSAPIYSYEN